MKFPVKYSEARRALAAASRVDEVKKMHDQALAIGVYARQAKDRDLINYATEIRMRAVRRLGELNAKAPKAKGGDVGGRKSKAGVRVTPANRPPTFAEQGVDHELARQARAAAAKPPEEFEASIKKAQRLAVAVSEGDRSLVNEARREITQKKKARRAERESTLAAKIKALPDRRYGLIVADPEWPDEVWSDETGLDRSPQNHYPTSSIATLCARDVGSISAPDCVLALWAPSRINEIAFIVMKAWGFTYKAQYVWVKDKAGTGYWNRDRHELLLIGVRGKVVPPAMGEQWESVIEAPRGAHSSKPVAALEMLEHYYPNIPKIELNRRGPPREGWDAWGNEAG